MTSPQRARDRDRKDAVERVRAACAAGRIIEPDRDRRIADIEQAQTLGEIEVHLRDLPALAPPAAPPPAATTYDVYPAAGVGATSIGAARPVERPRLDPEQAVPAVPYGGAQRAPTPRPGSRRGRMIIVSVAALAVIGTSVATVVGGIVAGVSDAGETFSNAFEPGPTIDVPDLAPPTDVDVLSRAGYADLVSAVGSVGGSTETFRAVVYPTYAAVDLPAEATGQRYVSYSWDGRSLSEGIIKSTSTDDRVDLASIDGQTLVKLVRKAKRLVDTPTTTYVIIEAPDERGSVISAYATNEFSETAYLDATADGTVTFTYDSTP